MIDTYNNLYSKHDHKILYIQHNSCFDLIMQQIFPDMVVVSSLQDVNYYFSFCSVIYNDFLEIGRSENKPYSQRLKYCLSNSICFVHDDIITHNKPEDLEIMFNSNTNLSLINTNLHNAKYIGYQKYGLPYTRKTVDKSSKQILIITNGSSSHSQFLLNLKKKNISFDNISNFNRFKDYEDFLDFLCQYKIVLSINDIDLLVAKSIGCIAINPKQFNIDGIHQIILHSMSQESHIDPDIFLKLNFHMFKRNVFNAENSKDFLQKPR